MNLLLLFFSGWLLGTDTADAGGQWPFDRIFQLIGDISTRAASVFWEAKVIMMRPPQAPV